MDSQPAVSATVKWLKTFIIEFNICPFASQVESQNSIRFQLVKETDVEKRLTAVIAEYDFLDSHPETATTLVIFSNGLSCFNEYLDFFDISQQLLIQRGYEGVYQLASFHPDYCFAGSHQDDAANFTNRSPFPMLHIIREESIEKALQHYPNPEQIPDRNIELTRQLGLETLKKIFAECIKKT